jgi:hypothetical protein
MLDGSPYQRLIALNGHDLSAAKQPEQQKKYQDAVAERQHESPHKRSERIAKYQAERKRDHTMLEQMTTAFDFHRVGKRMLSGHRVYVLKATPRKGYKPPDRDSQVLTGMEGTLWIDQEYPYVPTARAPRALKRSVEHLGSDYRGRPRKGRRRGSLRRTLLSTLFPPAFFRGPKVWSRCGHRNGRATADDEVPQCDVSVLSDPTHR